MTNDFVTQWLFWVIRALTDTLDDRPEQGVEEGVGRDLDVFSTRLWNISAKTPTNTDSNISLRSWWEMEECLKYLYIRDRRIELKVANPINPSLKLIEGSHFLNG